MKGNDKEVALVRIIALAVANGDKARAEELVRWAYETRVTKTTRMGKGTDSFIAHFLKPTKSTSIRTKERFGAQFIDNEGGFDRDTVKEAICKMEYGDFLKTPYWRSVAHRVKLMAGNKCERCGSSENLCAHHKTYEHHGDEIHFLRDLECLCDGCHKATHRIGTK